MKQNPFKLNVNEPFLQAVSVMSHTFSIALYIKEKTFIESSQVLFTGSSQTNILNATNVRHFGSLCTNV